MSTYWITKHGLDLLLIFSFFKIFPMPSVRRRHCKLEPFKIPPLGLPPSTFNTSAHDGRTGVDEI